MICIHRPNKSIQKYIFFKLIYHIILCGKHLVTKLQPLSSIGFLVIFCQINVVVLYKIIFLNFDQVVISYQKRYCVDIIVATQLT